MKKLLYLFIFLCGLLPAAFAQEDTDDEKGGKLRERMVEYIQQKLSLSKDEAEKLRPVFMDYLKQMRTARKEANGDKLLLQQKISEIRLRTRDQLKPIVGEKKSNEVFKHEKDFIDKVKLEVNERREQRRGGGRANKNP